MRNKCFIYLLLLLASFSNIALSNDLTGFGRVGLLSHYIFRGVDYNDKSPVVQADYVLASDSGWWMGAFASNWTFADKSEIEVDLFAGYDFTVAEDITLTPAVIRYLFPDVGGHTTEWSLALKIKDWTLKHHYDQHLKSNYSEVNFSYEINSLTHLLLHYGVYSNDNISGQHDYEVKATYQLKENTQLFAAFSSSDLDDNVIFAGAYLSF